MSADTHCPHFYGIANPKKPKVRQCDECVKIGGKWVHLRTCQSCGGTHCCDQSPNRHATAHYHADPTHPLIRSYEPNEDWWFCFADDLAFELDGAPPAPSHP